MEPLWPERSDKVKDRNGADHALLISCYNNLDADPADTTLVGPFGAFGLRARVPQRAGDINVWLICSKPQWDYFTGEGERAENVSVDARTLESRRNQVLEDFAVKVKLALRAGNIVPSDEIHVRLGPDIRVPPYGPDWRRALKEE